MKIVKRDNVKSEVKQENLYVKNNGDVYEYSKPSVNSAYPILIQREDLLAFSDTVESMEFNDLKRKCTDLRFQLDEANKENKENKKKIDLIKSGATDSEILMAVKIIKLLGE